MPFLQKLDLSDNELVSIEKTVQLKRLRECDLSGNRLTTLPRSFQSLKSLKVLNLTNNGFSVVPLSVANLRRLEELDMRGNGLRSLPAEMNAMNTLKILHLEDNAFTEEERKAIRERFPLTLIYF
jgi:Leucine-rich repeat (LRR) protein